MGVHKFVTVATLSLCVLWGGRAFAQLQPRPSQPEALPVADLRVVGNVHVDTEIIFNQIRSARGRPYSLEQAREDRQSIFDLGLFSTVDFDATPTTLGMVLTFKVTENDVIKEIVVQGNKSIPTPEILNPKVTTSKPDEVLNLHKLEKDAQNIIDLYRRQGYICQITDPEMQNGRLIWTIIEATIEKLTLTFVGKNDKPTEKHETKPKAVWRDVETKEGNVFNARKLGEDMNRLFALGIFEDVKYDTAAGSETGKIVVDIQVKERRTGQAMVGLGVSTRGGIVGFADLSKLNLQGMNRQLAVRSEFGDRHTFEVRFVEPWLDSKHTSFTIIAGSRLFFREPRSVVAITQGGVTSTEVNSELFEERRKGVNLTLARPRRNRTTSVFVTFRNEDVSLEKTDLNTLVRDLQSFGRVAAVGVGFIRDTRHNIFNPAWGRLDPTSGGFSRLQVEVAASFLGGDSSFRKVEWETRRYRPMGKKTVLAARFMVGRALGSLPAFEQFFVGGSETIRGYNIDHDYGDNQLVFNLEMRRSLRPSRDPREHMQLVLFMDWGDAWGGSFSNGSGFSPVLGLGVGFRVGTPIGPIRLDIGFGSEGARTHFSIGPLF